jgi:hypothetical protein
MTNRSQGLKPAQISRRVEMRIAENELSLAEVRMHCIKSTQRLSSSLGFYFFLIRDSPLI